MILFEAVVETVEAARAAGHRHVGRLEVCSDLAQDGLTPAPALVAGIQSAVAIPVHVMVRPRPGDFVLRPGDLDRAAAQLVELRRLAPAGFVFGFLDDRGRIATDAVRRLLPLAEGASVTFHRAFDRTRDLDEALDDLMTLGIPRVLTSGGAPTALEGTLALARLIRRGAGRIVVMPGGGIRPSNWVQVLRATGATELHGSVPIDVRMASPAE